MNSEFLISRGKPRCDGCFWMCFESSSSSLAESGAFFSTTVYDVVRLCCRCIVVVVVFNIVAENLNIMYIRTSGFIYKEIHLLQVVNLLITTSNIQKCLDLILLFLCFKTLFFNWFQSPLKIHPQDMETSSQIPIKLQDFHKSSSAVLKAKVTRNFHLNVNPEN